MPIERPDLSRVDPEVREYIEYLENQLESRRGGRPAEPGETLPPLEQSEPETTLNVVAIAASGVAKRTPRHLYLRQRRGGMGIFDLETSEEDPPTILAVADEGQSLLLFTNQARAFRLPVRAMPETPVRSRGQSITARLALQPGERLVAALPDLVKGNVAMVSKHGMVRSLRHHVFGEYMKPGTALFDPARFGPLAAACWAQGESDLFIATRQGRAIRFSEKLTPPQGGPGIRLEGDDLPVAITSVTQESGVFLICEDGRGTIRLMSGFNPNKSAGGSGKIALNSDSLVGAVSVEDGDDIFLISKLSKIIRFSAEEVPAKEGVVQGVHCMSLRADVVAALTASATVERL